MQYPQHRAAQVRKKRQAKEESKEKEPEEKTVVNIWSATFDQENEISAFLDAWSQTEGSKTIDVTFEEIPAGTDAERADALLTNLIGDGDIDIFDANVAEYFNFAAKGMFEDLEPYAAADGYDFDQMGASNVELSRVNGNLYAFPYIQSVWLLYYNKDLFDAAGLPYPTDDMTWDEFRETAKALTKGEGADKQWGFTMPDWVCTWAGMATQTGIPFVNEDNTANLDNRHSGRHYSLNTILPWLTSQALLLQKTKPHRPPMENSSAQEMWV